MGKFWKKKKQAARTWEEITNTATEETQDEVISETKDEVEDTPTEKPKEITKKGEDKFGKMIEALDFDVNSYYGWGDSKIDNLMKKLTRFWNALASIGWFLFGSITFAPILFIANKLNKFFDDKKKSFFISLFMYAILIVFIVTNIIF